LIITEAKNGHFFVCKRIEFVYPRLRDFVKLTLTRVIDCDSKIRDRVIDSIHVIIDTWITALPFSHDLNPKPKPKS